MASITIQDDASTTLKWNTANFEKLNFDYEDIHKKFDEAVMAREKAWKNRG